MTFPKSFQVGGSLPIPFVISNKTAAYTVQATDAGTIINCTSGTFTVSLTAAATLGAGFNVTIWNTSSTSTDTITIDPAGAETIDLKATLVLSTGEGAQIVCDGTNWIVNRSKLRLYADNSGVNGIRPTATGDRAVAIGSNSGAAGQFGAAVGYICNAYNIGSSAFGYFASASGNYSLAISGDTGATYQSAIGYNSAGNRAQAVTGAGAVVLGGSYASGSDSFAAAAGNNSSSYGATGGNSVALGHSATASGTYSAAIGGSGAIASATRSVVLGGYASEANATYSYAFGHRGLAAYVGKYAYGVFTSSTVGTSQGGYMVLAISTTDATATKLGSDGGAGGATNQVILANNSAFAFTGTIIARQQAAGGTASAAWKVEGLIRREANAASTTLVASTVTAISNVPTWVIALTADTTNGGLSITVTGAAATNIRWVATIQTSEVTYA